MRTDVSVIVMPRAGSLLNDVTTGARVVARSFGIWDGNPIPREWTHITKVDPEHAKRLPLLFPLYLAHTDAVSVGGSSDVTPENTEETFQLLNLPSTPAFHEPSEARHVTEETREDALFIAIPEVLNGNTDALIGILGEGIIYLYDEMIPHLLAKKLPTSVSRRMQEFLTTFAVSWFLEQAVFEAYIIQNPDSAAARRGGVSKDDVLSAATARQRAMVADRHLNSEVVYLEYSGTYGGKEAIEVLDRIEDDIEQARIWYGGGINTREKANSILDAGADTVVVGDIFHDVAAEEAKLCEQATKKFDSLPSYRAVQTWLQDVVEVSSSNAADYLSTIPNVPNPEQTAKEYLTLSIGVFLVLSEVAESNNEAKIRARSTATGNPISSDEWIAQAEELMTIEGGGSVEDYLQQVAIQLRADSPESDLPVTHLSIF